MNMIINLWNSWTLYEKLTTGTSLLLILVLIPLAVLIFTKQARLCLVAFLSLLITGVLDILSLFILNQVFNIEITFIFELVPLIVVFATLFSIGTMTGYYLVNHKHKDFSSITLKKENFNDSFKLSISFILLFTGFSVLTPSISLILLLSLGLSLAVIWVNYLLLYKLYR